MSVAKLSVREVAELADVPVRSVNKAIEEKIVASRKARGKKRRIVLPLQTVAYAAVLGRLNLQLDKATKRRLWQALKMRRVEEMTSMAVEIAPSVTIDVPELVGSDLAERANAYVRWRDDCIEADPEILGGTPVVRGTRLSVYSLLGRVDHGDTLESILEDYPRLDREALEAAVVFARAHPLIGRPGGRPWAQAN